MEFNREQGKSTPKLENEILGFDDLGFAIFPPEIQPESERHHCYTEKLFSRSELRAWQKLLGDWDSSKTKLAKLQTFIKRGVPAQHRSELWQRLLDVEALKSSITFQYKSQLVALREQLVDLGVSEYAELEAVNFLSDIEGSQYKIKYGQISMDALRHIFLDLDRSYPTHKRFMGQSAEAKEGRASLFRVLAIYARYNKTVEYCQGMASIAGMFLMYMAEEEAFWCLVSVLERGKYLLGYFDNNMERIQRHSEVFQRLISQKFPRLHQHLERLEVNPLMFLTPWFMCLYTSLPCWDTVLAIWDLLLLEGNKTIFRVALAILSVIQDSLLKTKDICYLLPILLHPDHQYMKYDVLLHAIWTVDIADWEVNSLLAVMDEEKVVPMLGKRRRKNSGLVDESGLVTFKGEKDRKKRQKTEEASFNTGTDAQPTLFRRFVNMFTPKIQETDNTRKKPHPRNTIHPVRHGAAKPPRSGYHRHCKGSRETRVAALSGSGASTLNVDKIQTGWRISPCETADEDSFLENARVSEVKSGDNTPVRRSPRLKNRVLRDSTFTNSWNLASVQHSFKAFHTPLPLRKTQQIQLTSPIAFIASPEVELQTLRLK